jgi:hypothetical protein
MDSPKQANLQATQRSEKDDTLRFQKSSSSPGLAFFNIQSSALDKSISRGSFNLDSSVYNNGVIQNEIS